MHSLKLNLLNIYHFNTEKYLYILFKRRFCNEKLLLIVIWLMKDTDFFKIRIV